MSTNQEKKDLVTLVLFLVIPVFILTKLGELFAEHSLHKNLLAGLFGSVGGVIGLLLYHSTLMKSTLIKVAAGSILTLCLFTGLVIKVKYDKASLITCEICGYKTLKTVDTTCNYCGNDSWETRRKLGEFHDKKEWLREEQRFLFKLDSLSQKFDFYSPQEIEGFEKDANWIPAINQEDLESDFRFFNE